MRDEATDWLDKYNESITRGELSLPFCDSCSQYHWYPKSVCPHCQAESWWWKPVSGRGRLFTWTEVHHAFGSDIRVPYTVVMVEPIEAEGIRIVSNLHSAASVRELRIGMIMTVVFDQYGARSKTPMPIFRPMLDAQEDS